MQLEHYPVKKLEREILAILGRRLDLNSHRVFFFGSRAQGTGDDRSDIDIGIEGPTPVPTESWLEIQEEVENFPLLYKLEAVDFRRVSPIFRKVALQQIEPIWSPQESHE